VTIWGAYSQVSARAKARKRAVDIVYLAELRQHSLADVLYQEQLRADREPEREASWRYAKEIVSGILANRSELDLLISQNVRDWLPERMPVLDRAILLVGAWEIRHNEHVPDAVAIAEAVRLAGLLSTEDSAAFVNGVLAAVANIG